MKIGVIGAGTMGQGIAKAFAQVEGFTVALCDIKQEWAENGLAKIKKGYEKLVAKGKMTQEKADEILAEAVRNASSDQVTAADGAAALSGVELFTLPVAPPPQVSGYDPENGHPGIDFAAEEGAEVYAVADGIVTTADYDAEKGNYVVLDHGGGLETEYQHLKSSLVSAGQSVVQSQVLGYVGSTGNSTGPHLHFEARQDSAPADLTGTALLAE